MKQIMPSSDRFFIPEPLTPLYYTEVYSSLLPFERLKYNQLHGIYFHEQIIFFEEEIIVPVISAMRQKISDRRLRDDLWRFEQEERRHSETFHRVLQEVMPLEYADSRRYFIRMETPESCALQCCVNRPNIFVFLPWLIQMLEERAMYCSRIFLEHTREIDRRFLEVQRAHLADEVDHVRWDEELITRVWAESPRWLKRINIRFLTWLMREFIVTPKRAAIRVIDRMVDDLGDLSVPATFLKKSLLSLNSQDAYCQSVFAAEIVPRTSKLASEYPEWQGFANYWFHHAPQSA